MHTEWHPQDWIMIVETLSVWDVHRDVEDDRALRASELQQEIARTHGFDRPSDFVMQSSANVQDQLQE